MVGVCVCVCVCVCVRVYSVTAHMYYVPRDRDPEGKLQPLAGAALPRPAGCPGVDAGLATDMLGRHGVCIHVYKFK